MTDKLFPVVPDTGTLKAARLASELVASALRHTDTSVELTVDAGGDMVRIEVRDDDSIAPGTGKVVSFELRETQTRA